MHEHRTPIDTGAALRALPQERPPASAWPALAARLQARSRPRRPWPLLATAAALALMALLLPKLMAPVTAPVPHVAQQQPEPSGAPPDDRAARIRQLAGESAALEGLLADADPHGAVAGSTAAMRAAVTQRMQVVDALLADPQTDPAAELPLWQERVVLMRQLVGLSRSEELMAAAGELGDGNVVMTF